MKTQADKKSVKDIQELKQRFTKFSIGLFAILTLSITLLASAYTYILQKSYTDIALETELKRDIENADAIHKLANKKIGREEFATLRHQSDENTEMYHKVSSFLNEIRTLNSTRYLYTATRNEENRLIYVVDGLDPNAGDVRHPGDYIEDEMIPYINKALSGKTAKSILISCGARLAPFDIKELRELMETDEMELDTIGDRKTALFVIISDTDDTFNFVVSILYTQLFNLLCDKADDEYGGRLPVHVRCLLDEFANIGQIPKFEKLIATIRSREISASIILQSQSQLKAIYKDNADTIVGNCDTTLFLGGKEKTTLKEISEILGKETIDSFNTSETRGRELSHGLNYQKLGKQLMTEDEIAVMDGGKCILQLRGVRPFFSDKFDITKHPKYKYLSDADPKNAFDMEKHLKRRPAIVKPDEVFDYYEIDAADLQEDADHEET